MDARHFDGLAKALTEVGSRRTLLGLLATLPVGGSVVELLSPDDAEAKDRRKRRKQRHNKRKRPGNRKHGCTPKSRATVCAGQCGPVTSRDTCGKAMDCGSCDCPAPCEECFTCQSGANTFGTCVVDAQQVGDPCGSVGQVCQTDGACLCETGTCANPTPICANGACVACSVTNPCPAGQCCDGDGSCGACLAFVTSTSSFGNLGGLSGADTTCQTRATAAGLPGTYLAWLSDDTGFPSTRFVQATVPYVRTDGTLIANNWADLTDGTLAAPLNRDESGTDLGNVTVWSDTTTNGTLWEDFRDCSQWTDGTNASVGRVSGAGQTDEAWTQAGGSDCGLFTSHLYCFQQR